MSVGTHLSFWQPADDKGVRGCQSAAVWGGAQPIAKPDMRTCFPSGLWWLLAMVRVPLSLNSGIVRVGGPFGRDCAAFKRSLSGRVRIRRFRSANRFGFFFRFEFCGRGNGSLRKKAYISRKNYNFAPYKTTVSDSVRAGLTGVDGGWNGERCPI